MHATNSINNSMLLHTLSILPLDSTIDSSKYVYLVVISHKYKDDIICKTSYINSLNKISDPNNTKLFYCKNRRKFIQVTMHDIGFMID